MKWISFFTLLVVGFTGNAALEKKPLSQDDEKLFIELTGKDYSKMSESSLYAELLAAYQSQNEVQFHSQLEVFMKKYRKSLHSDNVLYLAGKMALEKKNYAKAVFYFERVAKSYPASNKVVASQFAKGIAYKNMKLGTMANRVFSQITKQYPGSPESFRAEMEMKMIQAN